MAPHPQPLVTSPRWLAAAVVVTLLVAVCCVYISICLLFWQGQWQLVFKPSRAVTTTPAAVGLAFDDIQFDATETGVLQLHAWWLPASTPATGTLLLLHDGSGSLSDTIPRLQALHPLGMNVFVFDYRGFGKSIDRHPSEASTYEDADAAWHYLADTRHVAAGAVVIDGVGLGAAIAAEIARRHPQAHAVILEQPRPPVLETMRADPRLRLLPLRLLFHDRFDPRRTLAHLPTPKLFVYATDAAPAARYFDQAAGPKAAVTGSYQDPGYVPRLRSFLEQYGGRP